MAMREDHHGGEASFHTDVGDGVRVEVRVRARDAEAAGRWADGIRVALAGMAGAPGPRGRLRRIGGWVIAACLLVAAWDGLRFVATLLPPPGLPGPVPLALILLAVVLAASWRLERGS